MYDKYFNASLILASKFGMKLDMQSHRRISSPAIGGCCKTAEVPAVTALYERQEFRKDRICSLFEKEMIGWRDRAHNDVPTRFSFRKPVSLEHIVDGIQILTAAGKRIPLPLGEGGATAAG